MMVTVSGLSGLVKAYRSVLSATGSLEISGASRWEDMVHLGVSMALRPNGRGRSVGGAEQAGGE